MERGVLQMPANQIKVRRKQIQKSNGKFFYVFIIAAVIICLGIVAAVAAFSGKFNIYTAPSETIVEDGKRIIKVPAGGDLQAAINKAEGGDVIELKAGATYYGEIVLPVKPITEYITIQTSAVKQLPENVRVTPGQAKLMAKIVTKGEGKPAVSTEKSAHHYRFIGIEFTPDNADYIYNLVFFGQPEKVSETAHHLEIDRCYIHHNKAGKTRRGIALNSADTIVKNSYFEGFAYPQEETQAICGWTGTKNVKILNNYIEAGAENIMFGGSDPKSADLIPSDIEIRGNHLNKPVEWKDKVTTKCLFELKNAKRVQFVGNYLENNWVGAAFRITIRNQDGTAPFSTIEDVEISDNIINGADDGINILGMDDTNKSQVLKRLDITNNLFINIDGFFIQAASGENILIAHNTVFNGGNIATLHGEMPKNLLFRDNIVNHGDYGIHGHQNIKSAAGQKIFQNNVVINNKNLDHSYVSFPPNNFLVSNNQAVGFMGYAQNDLRLAPSSRFKGKGSDKTDIGSSLIFKKP